MGFKPFHRLEIAEVGLLGLTALGLMIAIASGQWLWGAIALWLTLALNLFNRLRREWLTRQQIRSLKQQYRQLLDEKLNFRSQEPLSASMDPSTATSVQEITALQQTVLRLEQSLVQVWQALRRQSLVDRLDPPQATMAHQARIPAAANPLSKTDPASPLSENPAPLIAISWQPDRLLREHLDRVAALSLSGDDRYLVSASWDQTLKVWDWREGQCLGTIHAHDQGIQSVAFIGDRKIATGSYDQNLKIWSLEERDSGEIVLHLDVTLTAHTGSIPALVAASDGNLWVSGSYDQTIKRWQGAREGLLVSSYDPSGAIAALALDPQQQWIASAGGDGLVTLWQMTDSTKITTLSGNVSSVESLAVSSEGQTLAAGCGDGTIKIWTIPNNPALLSGELNPTRTLAAHSGQVTCLGFDLKDHVLYSAGMDGLIKLWHPRQEESMTTLRFPLNESSRRRGVFSLALTPDGRSLIAGGDNGTIQIWRKS